MGRRRRLGLIATSLFLAFGIGIGARIYYLNLVDTVHAELESEWLKDHNQQLDHLSGMPVSQLLADISGYAGTDVTVKGFTQQFFTRTALDYLYLHQSAYEGAEIPASQRLKVFLAQNYVAGGGSYIDDAISVTGHLQKIEGEYVLTGAKINP